MALTKSNRGTELNQRWNVGAAHALYIHDGHWYHHLKRFPGALFDRHGYILFSTREEYLACSHLSIGKQISVAKPGISAIPGYVWVISPTAPDLDVHSSSVGLEGEARLVLHLIRERDKSLVKLKKKNASSRVCEICKFSFGRTYGSLANAYSVGTKNGGSTVTIGHFSWISRMCERTPNNSLQATTPAAFTSALGSACGCCA